MTTARRIFLVCMVGGIIGTSIALAVSPEFWGMAMLSGACAGFLFSYFSCDLVGIRLAVPEAFNKARQKTSGFLEALKKGIAKTWSILASPYLALPALISLSLVTYLVLLIPLTAENTKNMDIMVVMVFMLFFVVSAMIVYSLTCLGGCDKLFGANKKTTFMVFMADDYSKTYERDHGEPPLPSTYYNVLGLAARGLLIFLFETVNTLFWRAPKYIAFSVWFLASFMVFLLMLIHSRKRLLCGTDAAAGVCLSYWCIASPGLGIFGCIITILAGGLAGGVFGVLSYELAKRFLPSKAADFIARLMPVSLACRIPCSTN